MITFICRVQVKPEGAARFDALMAHVVEMTVKNEPGVAYYACSKSVDEPDIYMIVEVYRDRQAHAAHMATTWVTESLPQSMALMAGKPDIRQYVSDGSEPTVRQTKL